MCFPSLILYICQYEAALAFSALPESEELLIILNIKITLNINISYLTWIYSSMAKWVRAVLIAILVSTYNNIIIYIHEQIWMKKMNCQSSMEHSLYFLWQDLSEQFKITVKLVLEKWLKRLCIFVGESGISCDFCSITQISTGTLHS